MPEGRPHRVSQKHCQCWFLLGAHLTNAVPFQATLITQYRSV